MKFPEKGFIAATLRTVIESIAVIYAEIPFTLFQYLSN